MIEKKKEGDTIAKTELTIELENQIHQATCKRGVFGCFEVTIGWYGKERVDFITYDTNEVWRCYEIKVSKSDFHSKAKHTFCGNFNYFVMPKELYDEVKDEIPNHIGVYIGGTREAYLVKKAKKQILAVDEQILKNSMIRSLYRESEKYFNSSNVDKLAYAKKQLAAEKRKYDEYYRMYWDLKKEVENKYGTRWNK